MLQIVYYIEKPMNGWQLSVWLGKFTLFSLSHANLPPNERFPTPGLHAAQSQSSIWRGVHRGRFFLLQWHHIDGLMQKRHNSIANALELCLFCIKPSTCWASEHLKSPATQACLFNSFFRHQLKNHKGSSDAELVDSPHKGKAFPCHDILMETQHISLEMFLRGIFPLANAVFIYLKQGNHQGFAILNICESRPIYWHHLDTNEQSYLNCDFSLQWCHMNIINHWHLDCSTVCSSWQQRKQSSASLTLWETNPLVTSGFF